jgi:transcriptional regulator with XRE-family HTH domain
MSEKEYAKIIGANLRRIAYEHGKSQVQMSRELNINKATISSWMNGTRIPRMDKIDMLCNYFNVKRADIMEPQENLAGGISYHQNEYYINDETALVAQEIFENKELRALFDVQCDMDPDDLRALHSMALALKRKERYNGDDPA